MKILYLGNKLSKHGINATTIETLGELLHHSGFSVNSYSSKKNTILRLLDMLWAIVKHKNASYILLDTYSTSAFWFAFFCSQLARILKIKYIPILHGGNLPTRLEKSPFFCRLLFANAHKLVAPSAYLKFHFEKFGYTNIINIPNVISIKEYAFKERHVFAPKLLWVRAFSEIYNPKMAVEVVQYLQQKYPDATLTMVGPDKDGSLAAVKNYAQQLQVEINFTGKLSKLQWTTMAKDFDIFINTTNFDNMPVSVIEAMALGLPVVSTNVGGLPFIITPLETGYLVNENDVEAMVAHIEQIIETPSKAKIITEKARDFALMSDWEVVKKKWTEILQ